MLKIRPLVAAMMLSPLLAHAEGSTAKIHDVVKSPDGYHWYAIATTETPDTRGGDGPELHDRIFECGDADCSQPRLLVQSKPAVKPEQTLYGLSRLFLSPAGTALYFHSEAWATSSAVHIVDLKTGKQRFVTDGSIHCIVPNGTFAGDLVVQQHRYHPQGGSYDPLVLIDPTGKELGEVAGDSSAPGAGDDICGAPYPNQDGASSSPASDQGESPESGKIMPFTQDQIEAMQQRQVQQCKSQAAAMNSPDYEATCEQIYLGEISRWLEKYHSSNVSAQLWNQCYQSSGAKFSGNVKGWSECLMRAE